MNKPDPRHPSFGSEVRRLETPEHRRQRRRAGRWAGITGIGLGALALWLGIDAIRTGELVTAAPGSLALPGELVCAMGVFLLVCGGWIFWRHFSASD